MLYDALIIGASVSGLYTGLTLARHGWQVCIVDRRHEIGTPVRCGEATGNRKELARFVAVDESWIARDITGLALHINDSFSAKRDINDAGVVLHRDIFEKDLARKATLAGARILCNSPVGGITKSEGLFRKVKLESGKDLDARYFIGADGCESKIGQWAGLTTPLSLHEAASAAQYRVKSEFCNDGLLHFFTGSEIIAPGYIWVFPKSKDHVSVGAIVYGCPRESLKALHYLKKFLSTHMPGAPVDRLITGCVPLAVCSPVLAKRNLLVVGDAARQVNPLTAGGIMNSLEAADLASDFLLKTGKTRRHTKLLKGYSKAWKRTQRRQQKIFALFKEIFVSAGDRALLSLAKLSVSAFKGNISRAQPFTFPLIPLCKLTFIMLPKVIKYHRVLWK